MTDRPEHAIRCPWCAAPAGQRCTSPRGRRIAIPSHYSRITAWTAQTTRDEKTGDPQ